MPLYKDLDSPKLEENSHHGLWYERFFDQYDNQWKVKDEGKKEWVRNTCLKNCGNLEALKLYRQRRLQLVKSLNGDYQIFDTTWNFVTGLGLAHPVENGFAWHPTLGVPYLAGSAVKGLMRAWLEWEEVDSGVVDLWLGSEDEGEESAGKLIFFDAVPVKPVELTADVMTPHLGKWYENGGDLENLQQVERIPADWHDPVPIPFLAVKNASFLFAIAPRCLDSQDLVNPALKELSEALDWLGAGAKTAAGYGHFKANNEKKLEFGREEQKRIQVEEDKNLSPEEKILRKLQREFEVACSKGDKQAGGSLSSSLAGAIQKAIEEEWPLKYREQLVDLAKRIYKFQGRKASKKRRDNLAKLR
jgi:CRISPR-associated protein Cmr6